MKLKKCWILMMFVLILLTPLSTVSASPIIGNNPSNFINDVDNLTAKVNSFAPIMTMIFDTVFTVMFLFGVVRMGYSLITKTGQVMKFSSNLLIWVPLTVLIIRLVVIFMFTIDGMNVTLFASDLVSLFKASGYYISIGMILVGLLFYLFYKLINHPEFGRWGKRLWGTSALLIVLTTIMPYVLESV